MTLVGVVYPLIFLLPMTFKLFGFELSWWRLFQKYIVCIRFDIYVFTSMRSWWCPFVIDQHAELEYFNASALKQQSECRHVAPFWHIILILSQPVFVVSPECRVWLAENQEIPILYFVVWSDRGPNPQFTKLYAITLITAPSMRFCCGCAN
jgi:hypothetical protein